MKSKASIRREIAELEEQLKTAPEGIDAASLTPGIYGYVNESHQNMCLVITGAGYFYPMSYDHNSRRKAKEFQELIDNGQVYDLHKLSLFVQNVGPDQLEPGVVYSFEYTNPSEHPPTKHKRMIGTYYAEDLCDPPSFDVLGCREDFRISLEDVTNFIKVDRGE